MNEKRKLSVSGLRNIGALLSKVDLPAMAAQVQSEKHSKEAILIKTVDNIHAAIPLGAADHKLTITKAVHKYVDAAVREAYNQGHADALTQNEAVEKLLHQQYESRTALTMPSIVAAVMEQLGMSSLVLDLNTLSTVFTRCRIDYAVDQPHGGDVIDYKLSYLADVRP